MDGVCSGLNNYSTFDIIFCEVGDFSKLFFDLFIRESVPFFLTSVIFGILFLAIFISHIFISPLSRELTKTEKYLRRMTNGNSPAEKRKSFMKNYSYIQEYFESTKFLRYPWTEFSETLITPNRDDQIQDIRNSVTSDTFFHQDAILSEAKVRTQIVNFIPGFFISLGLLLTFIGLVAALMKTGEAFNVDANTDQMMNSLRDLLKAATFKFTTSIGGIGSALVYSLYSRKFIYSDQNIKINNICSIFEKSLRYESVEKLTISLIEHNRQQTTVFEDFGENFATALGDKLAPLQNELQNMSGQFGQMNQEALGNMIADFQSNLTSNSQELMQNLTEKLLEVGDKIGGLSSSMSSTGEQFNSQLSKATDNMVSSIEEINKKIEAQGETFEQVSEATKIAAESIKSSTKSFIEITSPLTEISEKIQTSLSSISETIEKLSDLQQGMNNTVEAINSSTAAMQSTWNDYQNRFQDIDDSFSKSLDMFGKSMTANQQNAQSFIKDIETQFKSALQNLSSVMTQLQDTVEDFDNKISNLNETQGENNNQN